MSEFSDHSAFRDHPQQELVHRVWAEFQEMPGLCLTLGQASRLFGIDEITCQRVLTTLVRIGQLSTDGIHYLKTSLQRAVGHPLKGASPLAPYLPVARSHAPEAVTRGARSAGARRILVVDDDPDIVRALSLRLGAAGFEVIAAEDGIEGTFQVVRNQPDVIILDIGLPGSDGHVLAKHLRANLETVDIPVIFLTARTAPMDFKKAQSVGAAGYFVKPYRADELLQKVRQVLGEAA